MFCRLFFIASHPLFESLIFGFVATAWVRARDGPIFQPASCNSYQHLRGRTQNAVPAHAQKVQVWRRIYLTQRAVQVKGLNVGLEIQTLREHNLEDISSGDVLLAALHATKKVLSASAGMNIKLAGTSPHGLAPERWAQPSRQFLFEARDVPNRAFIRGPRTPAGDIGCGYDVNLMAKMVKRQKPVEEHKVGIRKREIILRVVADVLELADNVVREISHRPRGERGYARHDRRTMLTQQFLDHLKDVPFTPLAAPATLDHDGFAAGANPHVRPHSKEGVATDLLTPLGRLQQERMRLPFGDGEKGGNGGQQVGADRLHHRNQGGGSG